mgnify:FL=1
MHTVGDKYNLPLSKVDSDIDAIIEKLKIRLTYEWKETDRILKTPILSPKR